MIKLDDNLLAELGLQMLPPDDKKSLLKHIYETLEMRVGTTLASQMTDAQLDEFESYINSNDEAGALHWLETNFPSYKDVVAQQFEMLKAEIRQAAPQILAGAMAQPQQPPQMPAPQYPQQMPQQDPAFPVQQPVQPMAQPQYQQPMYQPPQPPAGYQGQDMPMQPPAPMAPQPQYPQPTPLPSQPQPPFDQSQYGQAA